jgi:DNA-binding NarL/FixJ family response regulator
VLARTIQPVFVNTLPKLARLLLADDHPALLGQIASLLADGFEIVGAVGNGLDLLDAAAQLNPDVVVLDITMPSLDGIEAARRLRQAGSRAKLVFLTVHDDPDYMVAAMEAGGASYVVKERLATDLVPALRAVLVGEPFISPTANLGTMS